MKNFNINFQSPYVIDDGVKFYLYPSRFLEGNPVILLVCPAEVYEAFTPVVGRKVDNLHLIGQRVDEPTYLCLGSIIHPSNVGDLAMMTAMRLSLRLTGDHPFSTHVLQDADFVFNIWPQGEELFINCSKARSEDNFQNSRFDYSYL